jgi:hypothetical protein
MALIVATLLLFAAGPFILWPLIRTPDEGSNQLVTSPQSGEGGRPRRPDGAPGRPDGAPRRPDINQVTSPPAGKVARAAPDINQVTSPPAGKVARAAPDGEAE